MLLWEFLVRQIRRWRVYHRTYDELMRLDDRELADIHVTRGEIEYIARDAARSVC